MGIVRTTRVDGVDDTELFEATGPGGVPVPGPRVAVVGIMHGNEPVGDVVLTRLESLVADKLIAGAILAVRANRTAFEMDLRHTPDGTDLNRQWDKQNLQRLSVTPDIALNTEERRAKRLAPLLLQCDAVIDLHSTSRPSPECLLFRDDQRHAAIAKRMGVRHLVTGLHESAILDGGMCSNVGLDPGERSDRLGFTYEAGEHTDPGNSERAWHVVVRLLANLRVWADNPPPSLAKPEVYEVVERFRQAPEGSTQYRFVGFEGGEAGSTRVGPPRMLESFEQIEADEILVRRGRTQVVRAQSPFTMIMPAPTTAPGTDLFYFTQRRHGGLRTGEHKEPEEARREAAAIERMMDLLGDDELASGTTWVSFDSRQALDLCAELIGRCIRLDADDPHRQITVVGRGDWGGDESERRAGQRYRQAMRAAMRCNIPITRVQLLRGAALGWLDALTSSAMSDWLADRRMQDGTTGVNLVLSVRQPSTVSLLVCGDLDHAIRTGDTRHLRIAVMVEAATVEPDGASVAVRVVRAGMVSTRPELVWATNSLIRALKSEHATLLTSVLRDEPAVRDLLLPDGSLEARADREALGRLRDCLWNLQLRLWCDILQHEVPDVARFKTERQVARWLAATMASSGILDEEALRTLLVRREGNHWVVDPDYLLQVMDEPETFPYSPRQRRRRNPRQPLLADDVDGDNLERWIGWKRFIRGAQSIPGTRGKDLDLAYSGEDIQRRIARWFRRARKLAQKNPGRVMVVLAGDGLSPVRERAGTAWDVVLAHRALVQDANVRYLRIQHARGTHFSWMKDLVDSLDGRGEGQPLALQWEEEHGATVNVVLIAVIDEEADPVRRPWSLDGWAVEACGVLVSDLEGSGARDYKVALFTEPLDNRSPNQELLHFGRSHCEALLTQAGRRVAGESGAPDPVEIEQALVGQIASWIERVRSWNDGVSEPPPESNGARAGWVAEQLGLADRSLAAALAQQMEADTPPDQAARALWEGVEAWPGPLWDQLRPME